MTTHFTEYYKIANHQMSMPYCGLDDNGKCYFTDDLDKVTCKKCLKKLKTQSVSDKGKTQATLHSRFARVGEYKMEIEINKAYEMDCEE